LFAPLLIFTYLTVSFLSLSFALPPCVLLSCGLILAFPTLPFPSFLALLFPLPSTSTTRPFLFYSVLALGFGHSATQQRRSRPRAGHEPQTGPRQPERAFVALVFRGDHGMGRPLPAARGSCRWAGVLWAPTTTACQTWVGQRCADVDRRPGCRLRESFPVSQRAWGAGPAWRVGMRPSGFWLAHRRMLWRPLTRQAARQARPPPKREFLGRCAPCFGGFPGWRRRSSAFGRSPPRPPLGPPRGSFFGRPRGWLAVGARDPGRRISSGAGGRGRIGPCAVVTLRAGHRLC